MSSESNNVLEWRTFLTEYAVGTRAAVNPGARNDPKDIYLIKVSTPDLELQCNACNRVTFCRGSAVNQGRQPLLVGALDLGEIRFKNVPADFNFWYRCESCDQPAKSYIVRFWDLGDVQKIAEWPQFSPRTPAKLISLVGPDRDIYLKGRRAEIEGLGYGAFAYYRRIVENQKNRFIDEVIRVARHINAPSQTIQQFESAKRENQFTKSVEILKPAMPDVLNIKGHNPFTLLHSSLSNGMHEATDNDCLRAASDIRIVLSEFADRLVSAMSEQKELNDALTRLLNPRP